MQNKEKAFVSAVIYIHNAQERIKGFLKMLITVMEANFENSEIICVNDYTNDNSVNIIKEESATATNTIVSVLNLSSFHGVEAAMNAGVDIAIGDFVLEFDSTVQDFDSTEIMQVYHKALEGYDVVSASPDKRQKISSNIFYFIFGKFTDYLYKMNTESFRILSRRVINRVDSMNISIPYRKAAYAGCGLKQINMRYTPVQNSSSESKDKKEKVYRRRLAINTMILFTDVGYRFSVWMTAVMMLVTVFMAVYTAAVYLTSTPVAGWTTTVMFLSFAFFGLFGILTIIIKYLQILVDLVFKKRAYSFDSIEKFTK